MKTHTKVKTNLSQFKTLHPHTAFALMGPKEKMTLRLDPCQTVSQLQINGLYLVSERKIVFTQPLKVSTTSSML